MGMDDIAKKSAEKADSALANREKELLSETSIDWEAMKPAIGSQADYDQLISVVAEATEHNENVGAALDRLKTLGSEGIALAKKVKSLLTV
jgi:biopolymer transport protein ExbD